MDRYNSLKPYCKEAIIILSSEKKIAIEKHKIFLLQKIDYKGFEGDIREWIKCAFYLGVVFSKATEDHLSFFLVVDTKLRAILKPSLYLIKMAKRELFRLSKGSI